MFLKSPQNFLTIFEFFVSKLTEKKRSTFAKSHRLIQWNVQIPPQLHFPFIFTRGQRDDVRSWKCHFQKTLRRRKGKKEQE